MATIQKNLNDIMRILNLSGIGDKISIEKLGKLTGIPSLNQLIVEDCLMAVWKAKNFDLPLAISRPFFETGTWNTRSTEGERGHSQTIFHEGRSLPNKDGSGVE